MEEIGNTHAVSILINVVEVKIRIKYYVVEFEEEDVFRTLKKTFLNTKLRNAC